MLMLVLFRIVVTSPRVPTVPSVSQATPRIRWAEAACPCLSLAQANPPVAATREELCQVTVQSPGAVGVGRMWRAGTATSVGPAPSASTSSTRLAVLSASAPE